MTAQSIRLYPDSVLLSAANEVDLGQADLRNIVDHMIQNMYDAKGIGLAAPQVGIPLRIFVMDTQWHDTGKRQPQVVINPTYEPLGSETRNEVEGCLSLPGASERVKRWNRVRVTGVDADGQPINLEVEGLAAACVQHECDHLDGKLYIAHLSQTKRQRAIKNFKRQQSRSI